MKTLSRFVIKFTSLIVAVLSCVDRVIFMGTRSSRTDRQATQTSQSPSSNKNLPFSPLKCPLLALRAFSLTRGPVFLFLRGESTPFRGAEGDCTLAPAHVTPAKTQSEPCLESAPALNGDRSVKGDVDDR